MDCTVHGVAKSWTQLNDFHFTSLHFTIVFWVKPSLLLLLPLLLSHFSRVQLCATP